MTQEEVVRIDKDSAAVHEAGHLTVALALGIRGNVVLQKSNSLWIGTFENRGKFTPGVAIAGFVAECLATDDNILADQLAALIDDDIIVPPPNDLRHISEGVGELAAAISDAMELLAGHRSFFNWAVAELVEHGSIDEDTAWNCFHFQQTR